MSDEAGRDLYLGIDIGTASSKGVLVDAGGTLIRQAARPHDTSMPRPGWVEHDPEAVWWDDFRALSGELTAGLAASIAAVGVSGIGPCFLPATAGGKPLRPAILYGVDTRASAELAEQAAAYPVGDLIERCGSPLTSQAVGPKIAWVRRHEPEVWADTKLMFTASSFLVHRLTGAYVLDHHTASQCVPLYDRRQLGWISGRLETIAPGLEFPPLLWPGEVAGVVSATAAEATGLRAGTPVAAGTVDAWAEALSAGVTAPGDVMVMYGSTLFLIQILDQPGGSPALWAPVGLFPGTHCLAAGTATAGSITDWLRRLTGERASFGQLAAEAAAVPAGANGLVMLPYFAGERTPLFDTAARGLILGLTVRHDRADLYRAALEATAFAVRHNLEAMAEAGGKPWRLVAVGGGTTGRLWTQIVSDVTGCSQWLPSSAIGASLGAAMLAAMAVNPAASVGGWNPASELVAPAAGLAARYQELYQLYRALYPATIRYAHQLAELQAATAG